MASFHEGLQGIGTITLRAAISFSRVSTGSRPDLQIISLANTQIYIYIYSFIYYIQIVPILQSRTDRCYSCDTKSAVSKQPLCIQPSPPVLIESWHGLASIDCKSQFIAMFASPPPGNLTLHCPKQSLYQSLPFNRCRPDLSQEAQPLQ